MWQKMSVLASGSVGSRTDEHQQWLSLAYPQAGVPTGMSAWRRLLGQSRPSTQAHPLGAQIAQQPPPERGAQRGVTLGLSHRAKPLQG